MNTPIGHMGFLFANSAYNELSVLAVSLKIHIPLFLIGKIQVIQSDALFLRKKPQSCISLLIIMCYFQKCYYFLIWRIFFHDTCIIIAL